MLAAVFCACWLPSCLCSSICEILDAKSDLVRLSSATARSRSSAMASRSAASNSAETGAGNAGVVSASGGSSAPGLVNQLSCCEFALPGFSVGAFSSGAGSRNAGVGGAGGVFVVGEPEIGGVFRAGRRLRIFCASASAAAGVMPLALLGSSAGDFTRCISFCHGKRISTLSSTFTSLLKTSGTRRWISARLIVVCPFAINNESSLILKRSSVETLCGPGRSRFCGMRCRKSPSSSRT